MELTEKNEQGQKEETPLPVFGRQPDTTKGYELQKNSRIDY